MHGRTRIKMCGITRKKDAEAGVEAGLDALGFIFYEKSPRNVAPDIVRDVVAHVSPFVDCVGVFVDRNRQEVEEIVAYCGLSHAQLHGSESPKYCERLERFAAPCRVLKAFRVEEGSKASEFSPYDDVVRGFLLDTYIKGSAGGTGETFDWKIIQSLNLQRPIILAGGLTSENITQAIKTVSPYGVDVNSGVETEPGIKDHGKLYEFISKVRQVDSQL